jgi:hypothetical protein
MIHAVLTHCAGIDIWEATPVCVPDGGSEAEPKVELRDFGSFMADLEAMKG